MSNLKKYMIAGIVFVSLLGTIFHFVYHWSGNNLLVGFFAPVNESVWEHAKLLFFPMLIYSVYGTAKLKEDYPYIFCNFALGNLLGILLMPVLFYTYTGILGFNTLVMDVLIFYICVITSFYTTYKTTISNTINKNCPLLKFILCLVFIMFVVFTICPPYIPLFISP